MATAVVRVFPFPTGQSSFTLDLFPIGSDTAGASAIAMTEATNCKGSYTGTTAAGLTGWYRAVYKPDGSNPAGGGFVYMTNDTTTHDCLEPAAALAIMSGATAFQISIAAGIIQADLAAILATALTETTGGFLAAGFKKLYDVSSPVGTLNSMPADVLKLNSSATAAANLAKSASVIPVLTVDATVAPTTTVFETSGVTEAAADHYQGRVIIFTSGTLIRQAREIINSALVSGRTRFTLNAFTSAPAGSDEFVIV